MARGSGGCCGGRCSGVGLVGHPLKGLRGPGYGGTQRKTGLAVEGQAVPMLHRLVGRPGGMRMGPCVERHLTLGPRMEAMALQVRQVREGGGAHGGAAGGLQGVQARGQAARRAGQKAVLRVARLGGGHLGPDQAAASVSQGQWHGRHSRHVQLVSVLLLHHH